MDKKIYAYVVADIFHIGHLRFLEKASKLGTLTVGVLTDEATMEKKPKPIIPFEERLKIIKALKFVNRAVPQHTYSPNKNVNKYKPDILIESTSHIEVGSNPFGKVKILKYYDNQSSTRIKNKVARRFKKSAGTNLVTWWNTFRSHTGW